nr:glycyl-radical enzyme activating protein [uncultured Desulfobacter sp.]
MTGCIFDIKKYAIHDGPSIRTTVFFKGCPLRCLWCHNPEGIFSDIQRIHHAKICVGCGQCIDQCSAGALSFTGDKIARDKVLCTGCGHCAEICPALAHETLGKAMDVDQILTEIEKDIPFYDQSGGGVTFSGGEPLFQPKFLLKLLLACKALNLHCAVDTSLYTQTALLDDISDLADLFLVDIKHMDTRTHKKFTGVPNEMILANIRSLARQHCDMRFRIPLIEGVNTDFENMAATAQFICQIAPGSRVDLLPFHGMASSKYKKLDMTMPDYTLTRPSKNTIQRCADQLEHSGLCITIGG